MLISTITSNISFIQLSLMHRITEKICKERWQHGSTKISCVKVFPTLLILIITSNMSFIQLSLMLSGYPASSWLQHSHCGDGYHISPPTGLNLESAEISTSKLANSKQQMSKSIQEFLKCTLISSPLVRWKWPTQVRTLGTPW